MKLNYTWRDIAEITGGKLLSGGGTAPFRCFATDSRQIKRGDIFWAVKGNNFDGNDFISSALEKGAGGVVCSRPAAASVPVIQTGDALKAMHRLALHHRNKCNPKVACITGTNGKSSTKEMLTSILSLDGKTCANKGNLNNQYGLPLSLLELDGNDVYGVFELGASKRGDIAEISALALPDCAVITNINYAHMEFFGDLETVYKTKTEILDFIKPGGALVYNCDDELVKKAGEKWAGNKISFGFSDGADVKILHSDKFGFSYKGEIFETAAALDRHNKSNFAGACAAGVFFGVNKDKIISAINGFKPLSMRLERIKKGNANLIMDCYNANPASMKSALEVLVKEPSARPKIAVLGDIAEMGAMSEQIHREMGRHCADISLDSFLFVGENMRFAHEEFMRKNNPARVFYSNSYETAAGELSRLLKDGGTVLFKASRSMQFEKLVEKL